MPSSVAHDINTVPADAGDRLAVGELPTEKTSILYRGRLETAGSVSRPICTRALRSR